MTTKLEFSAGGIVYKKFKVPAFAPRKFGAPAGKQSSKFKVKVALILDPFKKWTFAKGHIEEGERPERAALREVAEETGMMGLRIVENLGKMDYWFYSKEPVRFREKGDLIHKVVYWYLMEAPEDVNVELQDTEGIGQLKWVEVDELKKFAGYKDMERVVDKTVELLRWKN